MDEIGDCVDQVPGLRVYRWPPGKVSTPAAVVSYPTEANYQVTYGRGVNTLSIPLVLALGKPIDRSTRDAMSVYLSGSGPAAIAALLDAWDWQSCSDVTAKGAVVDVVRIGAIDYLSALFTLDVIGQGAA